MKILKIILIFFCISCKTSNYNLDKAYKEFYDNKQLKLLVDTIHGNLNGILKYYYSDGNIKSIQNWKEGTPSGDFLFYDEQGKIIFHEKYNSESANYKIIIGNKDSIYNVYDKTLINFYGKYLKIFPDTGYYIGIDNYISFKNIPNQIIVFDSNNGIVLKSENKWVAIIKSKERNLIVNCYAFTNGQYIKLFTINKKVK
jgi:hypothetical protein